MSHYRAESACAHLLSWLLKPSVAEYAGSLNIVENTLGNFSFAISAANDALITGETYIKPHSSYGGLPSLEIVLGSDTSISFATTALGDLSPEAVTDTALNVTASGHDAYRLGGGKELIETHLILAANLTVHLDFSFPYSSP